MKHNNPPHKLILLCTGLGKVQRGFEMYIASLAEKLPAILEEQISIEVWSGGSFEKENVKTKKIFNWDRNAAIWKLLGQAKKAFIWEQRSFLLGMFPSLLKNKEAVFYLGEFQLYCYLWKLRKLFGFRFSLVLYTGGQAIPGLFDPKLDFVHHVTDVYLEECKHIPVKRQKVLPHFLEEDFQYDVSRQASIRKNAAGKKILLSVGLVDRTVKRMDLLVEALIPLVAEVYPVILGQNSTDTSGIRSALEKHFGNEGFVLETLSHSLLGDWYQVADVFVLCSPRESFGLAMVEALYHDLPVICQDFHEARFVLRNHAIYLDMETPQILTQAIRSVLTTHGKNGEAARFVREHYTWQVLQKEYCQLFETVAYGVPSSELALQEN